MADLVGKTLGKYKLLERLGKGGMAEVYKAYHPKLERFVTIKILHSYLAEGEDFLGAFFEREAKAVASLRHPHIVQIHDFDIEGDHLYMVMEFIDGGTLQSRMVELAKTGAYMPVGQVLSIMRQIAEALEYAHKQGIIHRDIKPSNILLDLVGNAFLSDFGIARMMSGAQFTATGSLIGTPTYMSPEQGRGEELTGVSDIYSLGVILYELLTGRVPFAAETPLSIIYKHINDPLPKANTLRPGLPPTIEALLEKGLAKGPAERFQHAGEMIQALMHALTEDTIAKLDQEHAKKRSSVANLPTERMDEVSLPNQVQSPPVVIHQEKRVEATGTSEAVETPETNPLAVKQPTEKKKRPFPPGKVQISEPSEKAAMPEWIGRLKSRPIILIVIGAVIVIILVFILSGLSNTTSCNTVEECVVQANTLREQGDQVGYISSLTAAIDHVPADQHPPNAILLCDRGDAERDLGWINDATNSFNLCFEWTQNNPELQSLRDRASIALESLR